MAGSAYPSSGFSGGGGTSWKSFLRRRTGRAILGEALPCAVALKIRRRKESKINAKIASLNHCSMTPTLCPT